MEKGLELLEQVECPVLVGDYPDMSPAIGLMLSASQMPKPETLKALNERLSVWAAARPNVSVFPLAKLVDQMRSEGTFTVGGHRWPAGSARSLMQRDRLHPTAQGLIALAQAVAVEVAGMAPTEAKDAFEVDPEVIMDRVRASLRARNRSRIGAPADGTRP